MIRNSLRLKTIVGIAAIEAILLVSLIVMMLGYIRDTNYQSLEVRAENLSRLFATTTKDAVLGFDLASLDVFVQELMTNDGLAYARVLGRSGEVLAASEGAEKISPVLDESVEDVDDSVFDTAADITEGGYTFGRVEVGFEIDSILATIDRAKRWSFGIAASEMLLVALFSFMLGRFLTNKLTALRDAAERMAEGKLGTQIEVQGEDEIDVVAKAFNEMSRSVKSSHIQLNELTTELKLLNETLEDKVERRTHELAERNQELAAANSSIQSAQARLLQTEKSAMVGVLTAGVAHEINNPLGFVMSNLKTLEDYVKTYNRLTSQLIQSHQGQAMSPEELKKLLKESDYEFMQDDIRDLVSETHTGLERVRQIVRKLSELSEGNLPGSTDSVNLSSVLNPLTERLIGNEWPEIKFSVDVYDAGAVQSSSEVLSEVFNIVLENACIACDGRGEISIAAQKQAEQILVTVEDRGTGIDEAHRDKIFDPFFTTRDVGSGTGLGLYRVKMLLEAVRGSIELDPSYTEGARFLIMLPCAASASDSQ